MADQDDAGAETFLQLSRRTQTSRRVGLVLQRNQAWAVRVGFGGVWLVSAWTSAPHTAVHINLPVKRLCLVAPPPLF